MSTIEFNDDENKFGVRLYGLIVTMMNGGGRLSNCWNDHRKRRRRNNRHHR
jgi:hypothetical protein